MRTKKVKPPPKKFEYKLDVAILHDDIKKKDYVSFKFRTTKEFLTFQYILKIESEVEDKTIHFNIIGFSAPVGELSNSGFAGYEYRFYDFKYTDYSVLIERKDTDKSKFKLSLQRTKASPIKLSNVTRDSFIEIAVT